MRDVRAGRPVAVIVGTRPEAIKLAGVVHALGDRARLVHTGQHFDAGMWQSVAREVGMREPDLRIEIGGRSRGEQIGIATTQLTRHLIDDPVGALIVQGDTNSTLAGALAGEATGTAVVHVEAGLRSGDLRMPEETNRLLTDRVATLCCAPTQANAATLRAEGIAPERIEITGNTLAEAITRLQPDPARAARLRRDLGMSDGPYVLATMHRAGNVDDPQTLRALLRGLAALAKLTTVVLPIHPRTAAQVQREGMDELLADVCVLPAQGPETFLALESGASLIVTDSGGVQEEAALFAIPCVILRDTTERPELLAHWSRLLGADDPTATLTGAWHGRAAWRAELDDAGSPYPPGSASERIAELACALADHAPADQR